MHTAAPGERPAAPVPAAVDGSPPPAPPFSPAAVKAQAPGSASTPTPPPAPPMVQETSPAPAAAGSEAQLPVFEGVEELLGSPTPAPPFVPADTSAQPPASDKDAQVQQQEQQQLEAEGTVKVLLMGRGIWHAKGKVSYPSDPQVPPAVNLAPSGFCDPNLGLEPTDDGRCVCAQGEGLCR
jgi:hypothetical protein